MDISLRVSSEAGQAVGLAVCGPGPWTCAASAKKEEATTYLEALARIARSQILLSLCCRNGKFEEISPVISATDRKTLHTLAPFFLAMSVF